MDELPEAGPHRGDHLAGAADRRAELVIPSVEGTTPPGSLANPEIEVAMPCSGPDLPLVTG